MSQVLIAILTPVILGLIKQYGPGIMAKVPGWMMPFIAALIGAAGGATSGTDLATGTIAGLAGVGVHQVKKQFEKAGE